MRAREIARDAPPAARAGLSAALGEHLSALRTLPVSVATLLMMVIVSIATTFTSNVATASIFLPVVASFASHRGVHPYTLMIPTALTCSLAFTLPVSTPPNAMAFASGRLSMIDMIPVGILLNAVGVCATLGAIATYGRWLLDLDDFPVWAEISGATTALGDAPNDAAAA